MSYVYRNVSNHSRYSHKKIDPVFIIIFGSYAKNSTHKDSDIDIAFYS
ncbi:nucleotidyltransferase domain-containing protein, partial [Peribacillus sp. NPDC076916]